MSRGAVSSKLIGMNALSNPQVELLVDGSRSQGAYAVLDITLPRGLRIPRHVRRYHSAVALLLRGVLELYEDDEAPVVITSGMITLVQGRPIAVRVIEPTRLVAILRPASSAELLQAAADPLALPDDRDALLAAAGITALPALRSTGA
jgi:hypothetical protein